MTAILRRLTVAPSRNLDLVVAWAITVIALPLVPLDHMLSRHDLAPWITACMVIAAGLRGRTHGDNAHPSLRARKVPWARNLMRLGLASAPATLLLFFDAARTGDAMMAYAALAAGVATTAAVTVGQFDGRTSWWPKQHGQWWRVITRAAGICLLAAGIGRLSASLHDTFPAWLFTSALLGVQFGAVGLLPDRYQVRWQRERAGRRDGRPYKPPIFRMLLALIGPGVGLALLLGLFTALVAPVTFAQGTIVALHVFVWAAVIWPPPIPVAVSCVLHEIVPNAGKDPAIKGRAGFDAPPKGALRLNPLGVKRIRVLHHWLVQVQDPRIEELDDPIRPLWPRRDFPIAHHVLGEATFEPEAATQVPQWHTITIRLDEQRDVGRLDQGNVQTRRLAILRPFPSRGIRPDPTLRTYRWDPDVPPGTLQVVDATTEFLTLQDGDILVLSTEGVARAFELEIGAPIYAYEELNHQRPPQLEDYVGVP